MMVDTETVEIKESMLDLWEKMKYEQGGVNRKFRIEISCEKKTWENTEATVLDVVF